MTIINSADKLLKKVKKLYYAEVIVAKNNKTVTVVVKRQKRHPIYNKLVTVSKKYHIHDENNSAKTGDIVSFVDSRPYSKTKRWRLIAITKAKNEAEAK